MSRHTANTPGARGRVNTTLMPDTTFLDAADTCIRTQLAKLRDLKMNTSWTKKVGAELRQSIQSLLALVDCSPEVEEGQQQSQQDWPDFRALLQEAVVDTQEAAASQLVLAPVECEDALPRPSAASTAGAAVAAGSSLGQLPRARFALQLDTSPLKEQKKVALQARPIPSTLNPTNPPT